MADNLYVSFILHKSSTGQAATTTKPLQARVFKENNKKLQWQTCRSTQSV